MISATWAMGISGKHAGALRLSERLRRSIAWLAVTLVLLNTLAMLLVPLGARPRLLAEEEGFGHLTICTVAGLVKLNLDGTRADQGEAGHSDICVNCLPLMWAALMMPADILVANLRPSPPANFHETQAPPRPLVHRPTARAPPGA